MYAANADAVAYENVTAVNATSHGDVQLSWNEPLSPNGLIVTYEVEIEHVSSHSVSGHNDLHTAVIADLMHQRFKSVHNVWSTIFRK